MKLSYKITPKTTKTVTSPFNKMEMILAVPERLDIFKDGVLFLVTESTPRLLDELHRISAIPQN